MLSYFRLSVLLCAIFLSCTIASVSSSPKQLSFRSSIQVNGELVPLSYVTVPWGLMRSTSTADKEGRAFFFQFSPHYIRNQVGILQVGLNNGTILAVRPKKMSYSESSNEFVITEGEQWEYRDITERPRSRGFFSRKARL